MSGLNEPQPRMYRPAWLLRMFVRFEDFGADDDSDAQDGSSPYKEPQLQGAVDQAKIETQIAQTAAGMAVGGTRGLSDMINLQAQSKNAFRQVKRLSSGNVGSSAGDNGQADKWSMEWVTAPMELTVEDKGFRDADTLEASFPFPDLPLFPLIVKECRVEGWVGTVKVQDFATPDRWHLEPKMSKTCVLAFNGYVDPHEMESDGISSTVHFKARSYIAVLIDGKINPRAKAYHVHGEEEPITTYINRILSLYPPTAGGGKNGGKPFRAVWYGSPADQEPKLGSKMLLNSLKTAKSMNEKAGQSKTDDTNAQPDPANEAPDPQGQGGLDGTAAIPQKAVTEDGISVWDLIVQACELCGVMPMYKPSLPPFDSGNGLVDPANCLLVTSPEAFLDDISSATKIAGGARDGFQRQFSDGSGGTITSDVRFMIWGHNIEKMKLARHMGKVRPSAVEVRSNNPDADGAVRAMVARFPRHNPKKHKGKGKAHNKSTEKGGGKIDVVRTFVVKGVRDQGMLERIAVSLYHQLTRAELTMSLETDELASYIDPVASQKAGSLVENHNDNPDILRLCAGTPVHVTVAKKSTDGADLTICALSEFYDLQANNIVKLLTEQNDRWGWFRTDGSLNSQQIQAEAQKLQAAYRAAKLPTVYYCKAVRKEFKADDTFFHCSMELCNYMPSNDPANMDADSQAMNDVRKRKPTSTAGRKKAAEQQRTDDVADRGARAGGA